MIRFLFTVIVFYPNILLLPCTVFFATNGIIVLGGNNEDWSDPNTKFWFIPSIGGKHGWIKFGFAGGYPQGGMNDQGVFWDATGCPYLDMPFSEENKEKFNGSLMQKVMEECASVDEAILIFENYYCDDQYRAQYLIGDRFGNSMIVEGDSIISKSSNYQVLTNFYHSHPELGGYPCWRYEKANELLYNNNGISELLFGNILASTHQEGKYPTQYSQIYNLKDNIIYLFYFHNFNEMIVIELNEELPRGARSYLLPDLFSKIQILSPGDDQIVNSSTVTFSWRGMKSSDYELLYSTDSSFTTYNTASMTTSDILASKNVLLSFSLLGIILLTGFAIKNGDKKLLLIVSIVILAYTSCSEQIIKPEESDIEDFSTTVDNLQSNKTYYWKVLASPQSSKDFKSESLTRSFTIVN